MHKEISYLNLPGLHFEMKQLIWALDSVVCLTNPYSYKPWNCFQDSSDSRAAQETAGVHTENGI
jgi:hypothetical protein